MEGVDLPRRGSLPPGLLGMLGLVLVVELLVPHRSLDHKRPEVWDWELTAASARQEATDSEILCFGDSQVKLGIMPFVCVRGFNSHTVPTKPTSPIPPARAMWRAVSA